MLNQQPSIVLHNLQNNQALAHFMPWFIILGFIMLAILVLYIVSCIVVRAKNKTRRISFENRYLEDKLPSCFTVSSRNRAKDKYPSLNYYTLAFPRWTFATVDGTRDRRHNSNPIRRGQNRLYIGRYIISCYDPIELMHIVNKIRLRGHHIERGRLEQRKYQTLIDQHSLNQHLYSVQSIVQAFEKRPSEFEAFCASIFIAMGYDAHVTPRSNDGGFDIVMTKDYMTYIVECKCFSPVNPVGRPLLQKLVGANAIQMADILVFVTTSGFSSPAIEYARQFNIWLIDGTQLLELYQIYISRTFVPYAPSLHEWMLNPNDLRPYYPSDMY